MILNECPVCLRQELMNKTKHIFKNK
jgi:hypothetical protein